MQFGGRTWTFDFYTSPTFGTFWSREGHWMVLASGVAVSLLLFQLLWTTLRREKKERELLAQVRQALDARDEFIAIAAHELRTPITSLRLQLQMATRYQAGEQDPAAALARLSRIGQQQVARLTTLINELLNVTRIQSGKFKVNRQSTDLNLLVHEMAGHYRDSLVNGAEQLLAVRGNAEPDRAAGGEGRRRGSDPRARFRDRYPAGPAGLTLPPL